MPVACCSDALVVDFGPDDELLESIYCRGDESETWGVVHRQPPVVEGS